MFLSSRLTILFFILIDLDLQLNPCVILKYAVCKILYDILITSDFPFRFNNVSDIL